MCFFFVFFHTLNLLLLFANFLLRKYDTKSHNTGNKYIA